jgi:hypothetical protein
MQGYVFIGIVISPELPRADNGFGSFSGKRSEMHDPAGNALTTFWCKMFIVKDQGIIPWIGIMPGETA